MRFLPAIVHPTIPLRTSTYRAIRRSWGKGTPFTAARHFASQLSNPEQASNIEVWEYPASDGNDFKKRGKLYKPVLSTVRTQDTSWTVIPQQKSQDNSTNKNVEQISQEILSHFLPAKFPDSVDPGYTKFAGLCFTASIAGSAAMVLSTQTLLLAVGIVGTNTQQAGIMAGAFNWVMKDFVGQLGGVFFASQMGKSRAFDADPKRWRMVAAMALDGATLLEILSPLFPPIFVLPVASVANVGKNIGFLTASASRAALHQSVAISGNLGDVTAKAGSQSIMASLLGTSLGIGMSSFLAHDTYNFALGFFALGIIHQGCNYLSLQSVRLKYFNRQRLYIVVKRYIDDGIILSPEEVAREESYFPFIAEDACTNQWLSVGETSLETLCPDPVDISETAMLFLGPLDDGSSAQSHSYLIKVDLQGRIHLMFFGTSTGNEMIQGMYHACLLRDTGALHGKAHQTQMLAAKRILSENFPYFLQAIRDRGWRTDTEVTSIENSRARRLVWSSGESSS